MLSLRFGGTHVDVRSDYTGDAVIRRGDSSITVPVGDLVAFVASGVAAGEIPAVTEFTENRLRDLARSPVLSWP